MARYLIKQKIFTLRDKFTIKNAQNEDCFLVGGKLVSLGKKITISTPDGAVVCKIKQRLFRIFPRYDILDPNGKIIGIYKEKFAFLRKKAVIKSDYGEFKMLGTVFAWDFEITQNDIAVATISKKILKIADTYTVDVNFDQNEAFMLAATIIIDAVHQKKR